MPEGAFINDSEVVLGEPDAAELVGPTDFDRMVAIVAEENRTGRCRCGVAATTDNPGCAVHLEVRNRLAKRAEVDAIHDRLAAQATGRLAADEADEAAYQAAAAVESKPAPAQPVDDLSTDHRGIADDPELWHGLTISGPQLGAQIRGYADGETRLALAVLPDAWETGEHHEDDARPVVEISSMRAVALRDLLNIATARGYLP